MQPPPPSIVSAMYVWLTEEGAPCCKSRVLQVSHREAMSNPRSFPIWHYESSSRKGDAADVLLFPVRVYPDPYRQGAVWVLCEPVREKEGAGGGLEPVPFNHRGAAREVFAAADRDLRTMFGFGQQFYAYKLLEGGATSNRGRGREDEDEDGGWGAGGEDRKHSVGKDRPREFLESLELLARRMGLAVAGHNWCSTVEAKFHILSAGLKAADDLAMFRFLLLLHAEKSRVGVLLNQCFVNVSTAQTRGGEGGITGMEWISFFVEDGVKPRHAEFVAMLGGRASDGAKELKVGTTRDCDIRIPPPTVRDDQGYFEVRCQDVCGSNWDPYRVTAHFAQCMGKAYLDATRDDPTEDNTEDVGGGGEGAEAEDDEGREVDGGQGVSQEEDVD